MTHFKIIAQKCKLALSGTLALMLSCTISAQAQIGKENLPDIDASVYKQYMNDKLHGTVKGYAFYLTKDGNHIASDARGIARTEADNNGTALPYKINTLQEIASVSKMITGVAMLRILEKSAAVNVNSAIGPWLPKGWKTSPSFAAITFRQLLSHKSGLRPDTNITDKGYENYIEKLSKNAINPELQEVSKYWNVNYQIMRIVIPNIIDANHRNNDAFWAGQLNDNLITKHQYHDLIAESGSGIYRNYVMQYLFLPSGITAPTCNPIGVNNLAWAYPTKASTKGSPGKDHSLYCSSGFWQVSARDLAVLMTKVMHSEDIISNSSKLIINNTTYADTVGWSHKKKRNNGYYYGHGGDINWGSSEVHSYLMYMPGNYVAYVQVNSGEMGSGSLKNLIYQAYDAARNLPYTCYNNGNIYEFPNSSFGGHISNVNFGKINQASGKSTGYAFFDNYATPFKQDSSYTLTLQSSYENQASPIHWSVWIDYNKNEVFDATERVYAAKSISGQLVKTTVKIPASAVLGSTRMRVALKRHDLETITDACTSFQYGEVEDYQIDITKPCGIIANLKAVNINSNGAQLTFDKPIDKIDHYLIRYEEVGTNDWKILGVTKSSDANIVYQLVNLKPNTTYRWSVKSNCGDYGDFKSFTTTGVNICGTDIYEGNINSINAAPIKLGETITALICSNTLTADQDWYKFNVTSNTMAGSKVNINLSSLPADYDLYLYSENSNPIGSSLNPGNGNEVIEKMLSPGTYYVKVIGYAGAENTQDYYQLIVKEYDDVIANSRMETLQEAGNTSILNIYPNPVSSGPLTIDLGILIKDNTRPQIQLIGSIGNEISPSFSYDTQTGKIQMDISNVEKGVYTIKVTLGATVYNKQLLVQ